MITLLQNLSQILSEENQALISGRLNEIGPLVSEKYTAIEKLTDKLNVNQISSLEKQSIQKLFSLAEENETLLKQTINNQKDIINILTNTPNNDVNIYGAQGEYSPSIKRHCVSFINNA